MQPGDESILGREYIEHWINGKLAYVQFGNSSIPPIMENGDFKKYIELKDNGLEPIVMDDTPESSVEELRKAEYERLGCTTEALIVALWEQVVENRPESANALQTKRESVKASIPKEA